MNERIEKLANEAKLYAVEYAKNQSAGISDEKWAEVYDEKFAELIVKECITQAKSVGDLRGANDDMIYGADIAALQISKHFGIE